MDKFYEENVNNIDIEKYKKIYDEGGLWEKVRHNFASLGLRLIYQALTIYYVAQSPNCPAKVKAGIYGALGYLIAPLDLVPDIMPGIGYSDDAAVVAVAVMLAQMYVTDDIREKARAKMRNLFGEKALIKLDSMN